VLTYTQTILVPVACLIILSTASVWGQEGNQSSVAAQSVICQVTLEKSEASESPTDKPLNIQYATEAEQKIAERLRDHVSFKFQNASLDDALSQIQNVTGLQLVITKYEYLQTSKNAKVDLELTNISLDSSLRILLKRYGFGYYIDDEVIKISHENVGDGHVSVRVYNLLDFAGEFDDSLIFLIISMSGIEMEKGSDGKELMTGKNGVSVCNVGLALAVRADSRTHREIEKSLFHLRTQQKAILRFTEESEKQSQTRHVDWNSNHTSYLDEPSAFNEVMWDLPSLNEKLPPRTGAFHPSINIPLDKQLFDLPGKYRQKHDEIVGYSAGVIILPEKTKASH